MGALPFDLDGLDADREIDNVHDIAKLMSNAIPAGTSLGQSMCAVAMLTAAIVDAADEQKPEEGAEKLVLELIKVRLEELREARK